VNGHPPPNGNTSTMGFLLPKLFSFLSVFMTLLPGDVSATGHTAPVWVWVQTAVSIFTHGALVVELASKDWRINVRRKSLNTTA